MSAEGTVTTKEGDVLSISEWVGKKENPKLNPEFAKEQEKEVKEQKRCLKRRMVKNGITPEYQSKGSEVRDLTDEEIIKEYIMPLKEGTISERGDTIRILIKFLQELEGRKVSTEIIVQAIKKPVKSVSSFLSQLYGAGIVVRSRMHEYKRKFIWGISGPYKTGEIDAIVLIFNDFTKKKRKERKERKERNKEKESEVFVEVNKELSVSVGEEDKEEELGKKLEELIEEEEPKLSTLSSNTLRIVVEGNIKILFGLTKE